MSASDPHPETRRPSGGPWIWVSAALAVIAVGLLIWGVTAQRDLDSTEQDVDRLQAQVEEEDARNDAAKAVVSGLVQGLRATGADLGAIEERLRQAQSAAESKAKVARECARAYGAALGSLLEGDSPQTQAPAVRDELQSITNRCRSALLGN